MDVSIPKTGQTLEATLAEWRVEDGQRVSVDDVIYTLETDKVELDVNPPIAGTIHLLGVEGETYKVGDVIATIDET